MERTVRLEELLPGEISRIREIGAAVSAQQPEITALWARLSGYWDDQFIHSSGEQAVARRERMLGITPAPDETLETRRIKLLSRYNEGIPYTRKTLRQALDSMCGAGKYELEFPGGLTLRATLALGVKKQREHVRDYLERVVPYNMEVWVGLRSNSWEKVGAFSWQGLLPRGWEQIREEELDV